MRYIFYLAIGLVLVSCNDSSKDEVSTPDEPILVDAECHTCDSVLQDFRDDIYLVEGWFDRMKQLDLEDASVEVLTEESAAAIDEFQVAYHRIMNAKVSSNMDTIQMMGLDVLQSLHVILTHYQETVELNAVPDSLWLEEDLTEWDTYFNEIYSDYSNVRAFYRMTEQELIQKFALKGVPLRDLAY